MPVRRQRTGRPVERRRALGSCGLAVLRRLSRARQAARRAASELARTRRAAVHRRAPDVRTLIRLMLHELGGVLEGVRRDNLASASKMFGRIARIRVQLLAVWDAVDDDAGRLFGIPHSARARLRLPVGPVPVARIPARQQERGLPRRASARRAGERDCAARRRAVATTRCCGLSRRGYGIPDEYLARDFAQPYRASKQVAGARSASTTTRRRIRISTNSRNG